MKYKAITGIMLILLLIGVLTLVFNVTLVKSSETIIVPDDYEKIQWAIGAASSGDTIFVKSGTYYEHVVVSKSISLIGENRSTTVIDGNGTGSVIEITAYYSVNVNGFTIRNGTNGIFINESPNNIISGNIVTDNQNGIHLSANCPCKSPRKNTIINNTIKSNSIGIHLEKSTDNTIYHNNFIINTVHAYVTDDYVNIWDGGYPSGGNYWSDHICTGNPSNGSQPYIVDVDDIDHYPFQDPNSWAIPGDINGDGMVDIFDVRICAKAYGSMEVDDPETPWDETEKWNPDVDLNNDGIINIFDIRIIAKHYLKHI